MGLITKEVIVKWNYKNRIHYEEKGFIFSKYKDSFLVKIEDLPNNCSDSVDIECDGCGEILENIRWVDYLKCVKEDGKYYCQKCAHNKYKKYVSFYEWCYNNLSKEEADKIILRWDYELNIDKNCNAINPKYINHGSNKLYWFKCLEHINHKSEQKNINSFTNGKQYNIDCNQCKSIGNTHPHLINFLVNKDDAWKYSFGSNKKVLMKCPNCGFEKKRAIYKLIDNGIGCDKCSDGVSYPEKFVFNLFEQLLNDNFQTQLSKKDFKWCNNYKYDFYIDEIECIIETHGMQHYEDKNGHWDSLEIVKTNDRNKEELAKENMINNYIILDCRKSDLNWIKNSIMNSKLPKLLKFKEKDIDWLKCHEYACSSLVKIACDLWNSGIKNLSYIAKLMKLSSASIRNHLKQGVKLNWCDYDSRIALTNKDYQCKKIICLTTNEIFNSILEASKKYKIRKESISGCCRNDTNKSAGRHPETNEKMVWMHYDNYIIKTQEEIDNILNNAKEKKIICLNTKEIFINFTEVFKKYNIYISGISQCCNKKAESAGKHPETGECLKWMYLQDYNNLHNKAS